MIRTPPKLRYNLSKNAIFWQKNEKNKNSSKVPYTFWRIIQQIILALERLKPPQKRWICNKWHFIPKKYIFLASIFVVSFYEARRRYNIRRSKVTYRIWKIHPQIVLALGRSEHPQNRGIIYHKMRFIGKKKEKKILKYPIDCEELSHNFFRFWNVRKPPKRGEFAKKWYFMAKM